MFNYGILTIAEAIRAELGPQFDIQRARLQNDLIRTSRSKKGARNRSIIAAQVEDGVLHTFHATKGPLRRRIAPPRHRAA